MAESKSGGIVSNNKHRSELSYDFALNKIKCLACNSERSGSDLGGSSGQPPHSSRVTDFYSVGCRFESCWDRQHLIRQQQNQRLIAMLVSASGMVSHSMFSNRFCRPFRPSVL